MSLRESVSGLSGFPCALQQVLDNELGPLSARHEFFVTVLEMARPEAHPPCVASARSLRVEIRSGRHRRPAFIARAAFDIATTRRSGRTV